MWEEFQVNSECTGLKKMTADVLGEQSERNILEHDVAVDVDVVKRGEWKHIVTYM